MRLSGTSEAPAKHAGDLAVVIADLQVHGATSLRALADGLNAREIPALRRGAWSATQVMRVMARAA